jgi:nucleotide-binding universal stress UspA family protein
MKPKILLAVDGSEAAMRAVAHVGDILAGRKGSEVTLCHVVQVPPRLLEHGGAGPGARGLLPEGMQTALEKWEKEVRERVEDQIMRPAKQILKERGVDANTTLIRANVSEDAHPDVALHIIRAVEARGFDAVVLGRRGRSALREFALGSVTSKVIHHIKNCPVWVVD